MSEESVRLARETYDAWNRGDLEAIVAGIADDFEFHMRGSVPGLPNMIRGRDGVRELYREWIEGPWQGNLSMDVDRLIDLGDGRVLSLLTFRGTGKGSGIAVEQPYAHVATHRQGKLVHVEGYVSWERALEAVGIDPAELERSPSGDE
jgi:ketosteroid isomerase-like protein